MSYITSAMSHLPSARKNKRGVALLLALFTLIILAMLVVVSMELTTTDLQITRNLLSRYQASYIADAGIEYAISRLRNNKNWQTTSQSIEFPVGSGHTYIVTYPSASGKISSIGRLATGEEVVAEAGVTATGGSSPYNVKIVDYQGV